MNQFLKIIERWGEPVFVVLASATLPVWFPLLAAWVIIDPFYRVGVWKSQRREASQKPSSRLSPRNLRSPEECLAMTSEEH
jgi:hypothetical protein